MINDNLCNLLQYLRLFYKDICKNIGYLFRICDKINEATENLLGDIFEDLFYFFIFFPFYDKSTFET